MRNVIFTPRSIPLKSGKHPAVLKPALEAKIFMSIHLLTDEQLYREFWKQLKRHLLVRNQGVNPLVAGAKRWMDLEIDAKPGVAVASFLRPRGDYRRRFSFAEDVPPNFTSGYAISVLPLKTKSVAYSIGQATRKRELPRGRPSATRITATLRNCIGGLSTSIGTLIWRSVSRIASRLEWKHCSPMVRNRRLHL